MQVLTICHDYNNTREFVIAAWSIILPFPHQLSLGRSPDRCRAREGTAYEVRGLCSSELLRLKALHRQKKTGHIEGKLEGLKAGLEAVGSTHEEQKVALATYKCTHSLFY